ncbi:putative ABC transporter arginine-binding protein 2 precursor [Variovorax boronicumulans]|uniref:ABC transporter substrate-binding protein n=1 Tax=Variovorax boronicumulans TaxID=436515 RepID=UPI000BB331B9|nr:ABC transporter substrate-binding protein [Variovorax boronicumulans]PBI87743.1 putative ABC transporter arginine-binding protein 2 precursor [Variovorax boronicumulans]
MALNRFHLIATAVTLSCVSTLTMSQALPKNSEVKSTGKLRITNTLSYAPFEFADEAGNPAGLNIELAKAAASALGVELEVSRQPFPSQIPGLAAGRTKVAWASFTVTSERLKQVDFVTFLRAGTVLLVPTEKAVNFKTKDDLCGAQVAVQSGAAADFAADKISAECKSKGKEAIKKAIYPDQKEAIQAVVTGRVVGRLDDATAGSYYASRSAGKMVVVPGEYSPLPLGVAVAKGDTESAEMMRAVLQRLMDDGSYKAIINKYGMGLAAIEKSVVVTSAEQLPKQ